MWRREDGEREVRRRAQAERTRGEQLRGDGGPANFKKTKGQGHHTWVTPARLQITETLALSEIQQQGL